MMFKWISTLVTRSDVFWLNFRLPFSRVTISGVSSRGFPCLVLPLPPRSPLLSVSVVYVVLSDFSTPPFTHQRRE